MYLSRFNEDGIVAFQNKLQKMRDGEVIKSLNDLVGNNELVDVIDDGVEITVTRFDTRLELATYVNTVLSQSSPDDVMSDTGLWAWLSAVFIDSVCPADKTGKRRPGNDYRHVSSSDWRHFYRHLIRGPVRIYRLFEESPEKVAIVLCQHPSSPGDFSEQLASRQERITNPAILAVANKLYYDEDAKKPKKGAAPNWPKPGTLRRFTSLLDQLDLTYDLYSMKEQDILDILPEEFELFVQ